MIFQRKTVSLLAFLAAVLALASLAGPVPASGDRPTEEVAFYYNKIAWSYAETGTTVEDFWAGEYP